MRGLHASSVSRGGASKDAKSTVDTVLSVARVQPSRALGFRVAHCGCGAEHDQTSWERLRFAGSLPGQPFVARFVGGIRSDMRLCLCGRTLGLHLPEGYFVCGLCRRWERGRSVIGPRIVAGERCALLWLNLRTGERLLEEDAREERVVDEFLRREVAA